MPMDWDRSVRNPSRASGICLPHRQAGHMTASNVRVKNRRATPLQTQGSPHMRFPCSTSLRHSVSRGTKVCPPLTLQCLLHQRSQLAALRKRQVLDLAANLCIHPVNRLNLHLSWEIYRNAPSTRIEGPPAGAHSTTGSKLHAGSHRAGPCALSDASADISRP